jgi:rare lipoprotein A
MQMTSRRQASRVSLSRRSVVLRTLILCLAALLALSAAAHAANWTGKASYYSLKGRTAHGGRVAGFTAAHRTLPFGARARVTNLRNNRSVIVTINDRGPFTRGRVIDVSTQAAEALGFRTAGVTEVRVEALE